MNQKPWLWKKRSMEKTIFAVEKVVNPSRTIQEQAQKFPADKESELERSSPKSLNQKLASVLLDCHDADDPEEKHLHKSQEKIRGEDKATEEVESLEKEEDEDLSEEACAAERMCGPDPKRLREQEKIQKELEEKLMENSKRLADLTIENASLTKALLAKEKYIEDLLKCKHEKDEEYSTVVDRLESTEKENAFLRYEFHMLEKELEIRKEEMDYSRQYADASHKQYQETIQKVSKLEAECQRLRLLLQKRSPQHAVVNMRNEVGMIGRETDMRRRRSNPTRDLICNKNTKRNSPEVSNKSIGLMMKRLQDLDEENKALKRILTNKNTELESSRIMYAQTATRLSQAEILLRKFSEDHKKSMELSVTSKFDISSDDGVSSSGSWATALISELEQLRTGEANNQKNCKAVEVSEMSLLDDFTEMEKRAIVSVDTPKIHGQELGFSERKQEMQVKYATAENSFDWLQIVLKATLEQKRISKRSLDELLEDIRIVLGCLNTQTSCKSDTTQKSRNSNSFNSNLRNSISRIIKLIEGIAPMSLTCNNFSDDCLEKNQHSEIPQSPTSKEYFVHVFQWKLSDLNPLLHRFVHTCKDLLTGRADLEIFAQEVAFALDWSLNNCATNTNSSIARDKIKKHFRCHQSQNENENQIGVDDDKLSFCSPLVASPDDQSVFFNKKDNQYDLQQENRKLKDDLRNTESERRSLEVKLLSVTEERQCLMQQLQEAQNSIKGLQSELETQRESNEIIEDQIEKQKLINEDLDTQLTISHSKLNDIFQKFSSLEVELEDKKNSCEELEATCLELQLQLESIAKKESPTHDRLEVEKLNQTGWEITTASSKLAECQETILNLGKQLKALASSSDTALFDSVLSKTSSTDNLTHKKNLTKRASLLSQMQAEDSTKSGSIKSSQNEEKEITRDVQKPTLIQSESDNSNALQATSNIMIINASETNPTLEQNDRSNAACVLAIVPSKKQGGFGFLRKLLLRRKKGKGKGTQSLDKA
ncbi:filament-like plant protein 7 [Senna tora]|uniref:Filament-like plant protein 7 n=1 Tax=Senna tora TaxID=362788 RepID=A0A834SXZ1_9FABA|nr:filament-like plant protein 7 [Senna tora]